MSKKPADGERTARIGYEAQDKRAANLIYDFLVEGRLDWFKIADPNAGKVDDIQIATTDGELHAFQVKWAETTQTISFAEITYSGNGPSLIGQLADGWRLLKSQYPQRRIYVHLIHRNIPDFKSALKDSRIKLPLDDPPPTTPSFQAFIRDCWEEKKDWLPSGLENIPQGWHPAMVVVREEAKAADDQEFLDFLNASHLQFNYQFPKLDHPVNQRSIRREKDVDNVARLIAKLGGGEKRIIEITRDVLLQHLGWQSRFEFRFKHEFPVDETFYQPITRTIEKLETAINHFNSGYLALLGTPGSGKSTTLTHTLRYRKGLQVIRYYAYVPTSPLQEGRGEAHSFFHDLHLALQHRGIFSPSSGVAQPQSLDELREYLMGQLGALHEKWAKDQIRTLIIVDGLDHIEREQSPNRSLLKELFLPDSIPEGVLIILGSQTLELKDLSTQIRNHLTESGRSITLESLTRPAVFNIMNAFGLPCALQHDQMEKINVLSNGHPLALWYLLINLRNASDEARITEILNSTEPYESHISANYKVYWDRLEQSEDLKNLLGLLSRLRGPFSPKKLIEWAGQPTVKLLVKQARHYFREESEARWHFFHNSFRQFILNQTQQDILGSRDPERDKEYHRRLADLAAADSDQHWSWEELFHRACAEDWDKVLQIGTQEYFRNQFFMLRSLEAIHEDTALCFRAARIKRDGLALIRGFLIEKELGDRHQSLDISEVDLPRLLYEIHGMDVAINYVIDGQQLLIGTKEAMEFVSLLIDKRQLQAAEKVFNAAEPMDVLSGSTFVDSHGGGNLEDVYAWANVACYFRPLGRLFSVIEQLRANPKDVWGGQSLDGLEHVIKTNVFMTLTEAVFDTCDNTKLIEFKDLLKTRTDSQKFLRRLDLLTCHARRNQETSADALQRLLQDEAELNSGMHSRLQLAEFMIHIRADKETAENWISEIPQPALREKTDHNWHWDDLRPFSFRIRLNRLLAMLRNPADPKQAVPDEESSKHGGVLFERNIVTIANLSGKAWAGEFVPSITILQELRPALSFFYRNHRETRDWTSWYWYRKIAPDYFTFLVISVTQHGPEALHSLGEEFDRRWEADAQHWPTDWRRKIALTLYRQGGSKEDLIRRLDIIETQMSVWDDVASRTAELSEQTLAWLEAERYQRAKSILPQIYKGSFGIVLDKDYQFCDWVECLATTTSAKPGTTAEDIRRFAGALVTMEQTGRGRGRQEAASNLIALTAKWHPNYGLELKDWLLAHHSIHYSTAVAGILRAATLSADAPLEMIVLLTCHLLIPFRRSAPSHLPKLLAKQCTLRCSPDEARSLLHMLETCLESNAFPSSRAEWWRGFAEGLQEAGSDSSHFLAKLQMDTREKRYESESHMKLKSGEKLSYEDAVLRITSVQDLLDFIEQIEEVKYFRWNKAIEKILDKLSYEQINALRTSLAPYNIDTVVEALFVKRLKALGYVDEGQEALQSLLDQSRSGGWSRYWDGGSRLSSMQTYIEFYPEQGREMAYDLLVNDYLSGWRTPNFIFQNLDDYMPLLFAEAPLFEIWQEIREHVYQLDEFTPKENLLPEGPTDNFSWPSVLLRLVRDTMQIEIPELREEAFRAFCKLCSNPTYDMESNDLLHSMLNDDDKAAFQALAVLESVHKMRPESGKLFSEELNGLCSSPNMTIRTMANTLMAALGINFEEPSFRPLVTTSTLELPDFPRFTEEAVPLDSLPVGASLPDSKDPLEMIRPFQDDFEFLSELSGIPRQNLINRAAILMKELAPEERWNKQAQEEMKDWFNAADLQLTYNRLRPKQAIRALNYVTAELADAGKLSEAALKSVKRRLRAHDHIMSAIEPAKRPDDIALPDLNGKTDSRNKNWVENGREALALIPERLKSGQIVLAELTRVSYIEWQVPTEYRFSMLCHRDWPELDEWQDAYKFFPSRSTWYACDYPELDSGDLPAISIYGRPRFIELGREEWLAINPNIAMKLGWQLCSTGLFRWKDSEGRTMVESICWQDGPINRQSYENDVCSEGWIVLSSTEAFETIRQNCKPMVRLKGIRRKITIKNGQSELARFVSSRKAIS